MSYQSYTAQNQNILKLRTEELTEENFISPLWKTMIFLLAEMKQLMQPHYLAYLHHYHQPTS